MENNTNGEVTNEELARMIAEGFHGVDANFSEVKGELKGIKERLDNIERILLEDHHRRIGKLENQVQELRDALAMK